MAFVTRSGKGFELRESTHTPHGPRAKTLATFRVLSEDVLDKAAARATRPFDREALRRRAMALGAPMAPSAAFEAGRRLAGALAQGRRPPPALAVHLAAALARIVDESSPELDSLDDVVEWIGQPLERRGDTLWQLLELGDALPKRRRGPTSAFPRLVRVAP